MHNPRVYIDFETYSEADLPAVGQHKYATHDSTEVLCIAWFAPTLGINTPQCWHPALSKKPDSLLELLEKNENVEVHAWNAAFEYAIWHYVAVPKLGWTPIALHRWRDTQAVALYSSFPRSLDLAGVACGLPPELQKDKKGKDLIRELCMPRKPTKAKPWGRATPDNSPEQFESLYRYCKQDVLTEAAIAEVLPFSNLPKSEQAVWQHTLEVNKRGIPVSLPLVQRLQDIYEESTAELIEECSRITGGAVQRPTEFANLNRWMREQGESLENLQKATIITALSDGSVNNPTVKRVLQIKSLLGQASPKKLKAILERETLGIVRDNLLYHSATTGRWGGTGLQVQNLARHGMREVYLEEVIEDLALYDTRTLTALHGQLLPIVGKLVRACICAPKGHTFIGGDYASIENRIIAWLSEDVTTLSIFESGGDQYLDMASFIYKKPYAEMLAKYKENDPLTTDQRRIAKNIVLGCQYGMGAKTFVDTAFKGGQQISLIDAQKSVDAYRARYSKVVRLWYDGLAAAVHAIRNPKQRVRYKSLVLLAVNDNLHLQLPSGRHLTYPQVQVETSQFNTKTFSYGVSVGTTWVRNQMRPGMLTENIVQGIARDILVEGMKNVENLGFPVVMHVHDEVVCLIKNERLEGDSHEVIQGFKSATETMPPWASGLPIVMDVGTFNRFN